MQNHRKSQSTDAWFSSVRSTDYGSSRQGLEYGVESRGQYSTIQERGVDENTDLQSACLNELKSRDNKKDNKETKGSLQTCKKLCALLKTVDKENQATKKLNKTGESRIKQLEAKVDYLENELTVVGTEKSVQTSRLHDAQEQRDVIQNLTVEMQGQVKELQSKLEFYENEAKNFEVYKTASMKKCEKLKCQNSQFQGAVETIDSLMDEV